MAALLSILTGCVSFHFGKGFELDTNQLSGQSHWERTVRALAQLLAAEAPFPEDFMERLTAGRKPGDFDPSRLFSVLQHVRMESGFSLDYVYACSRDSWGDIMGGEPFLYALRSGSRPSMAPVSYDEARQLASELLLHIVADGTPDSYFELAVLEVMGNHFYVFWHAIPGKDLVPICGRETLRNFLTPLGMLYISLRSRDMEPKVILDEEAATVTFLAFTEWAGLSRRTYVFKRNFPHDLVGAQTQCLLFYDRYFGVTF